MLRPVYCTVEGSHLRDNEEIRLRKRRQDKLVLGLSLFAMVLSTFGLSAAGLIYMHEFRLTEEASPTTGAPIACVVCAQLIGVANSRTNPDPMVSRLTTKIEHGVQMCCAYNSEQMSALLELTLRRQESVPDTLPDFDPQGFSLISVSAHKRLYPPIALKNLTVPKFEEDSLVVTHFKAENDHLVEHIRGVDVLDDGLRVKHSGQYFIYSNIHFRPDSAYPCNHFAFQTWGHYVMKIVPDYPGSSGCILKTVYTCCDKCTRADETSFTSGVFYLKAGDIIKVKVSAHGLVYFSKQTSYLGLMMFDATAPGSDQKHASLGLDSGVV